jgi:anti-sigma factor RsiW
MCDAVSDMAGKLTSDEMADLSALADGTLPADRRAEVERRVAASPELQGLLERQRAALAAIARLPTEEVPASLHAAIEARAHAHGGKHRRWSMPRFAFVSVAAVIAAIVAAVVLTGGPAAPTIADAARLATRAPNASPPPPAGTAGTRLALRVDGVSFPDLTRFAGWRAVGVRRARIDSRDATVVYYRKDGRSLGYVIVSGTGLARPQTNATVIRGKPYQALRLDGQLAVTWRRAGHTCVLLGRATSRELLRLASWSLTPPGR